MVILVIFEDAQGDQRGVCKLLILKKVTNMLKKPSLSIFDKILAKTGDGECG